jgi:D-alanyl-lipoteichoic acid acyltransferase DltB (MBOAT superfamily)
MSFTSWQYAFFLTGVFCLYWRLALRGRLVLLLAASYFFYGVWDARFLALLLTSTCIDFFCGLAMTGERRPFARVFAAACLPFAWLAFYSSTVSTPAPVSRWILGIAAAFPVAFMGVYEALWRLPGPRQRRAFLILSILTNLGVLGFFKYFNFFAQTLITLLSVLGWHPGWTLFKIVLPIAVSFYTFQSISYSVDVFKGKAQPARDFLTFAAYLSFFPQLIAGPIERPNDLLPQFQRPAGWDVGNLHRGLRLILIGLFKKVYVADNCAILANYAFDPKTPLNSPWAVLGVLAFAFQIYGDFSGYTDIARGSARLLGIQLNRNFYFPYFARGPSDFWQRWHVTLSSWFRDYVYIPLGGNRGSRSSTLGNLWVTMLLAGLWHGANWTYVLWGAYHGTLLILYRITPLGYLEETDGKSPGKTIFSTAAMFAFTLLGWTFFRCRDLAQLANWFAALGHWRVPGAVAWSKPALWLVLHVVPLLLLQWGTWRARDEVEFAHWHWVARGLTYALLFILVATSLVNDVEFIYFQF